MFFSDCADASNYLDRSTLIQIVHKTGTDLNIFNVSRDYFYNRIQFTSFGKNNSALVPVASGLLQGTFYLHLFSLFTLTGSLFSTISIITSMLMTLFSTVLHMLMVILVVDDWPSSHSLLLTVPKCVNVLFNLLPGS